MCSVGISNNVQKIEPLIDKLSSLPVEIDNPISKMHNYLAKKPYNVLKEIIDTLSNEGEIVYDGYMGSGTTGYEALKARRRFLGIDINKVSTNYFESVAGNYNIDKLDELLSVLKTGVLKEIEEIYYTVCPVCGNQAIIERESYDKSPEGELILKKVKYICHSCSPGRKTGIYIDARQIDKDSVNSIYEDTLRYKELFDLELMENKHIAIQPGAKLGDYFCNRGKIAIGLLKKEIESLPDIPEKKIILFTFSSSLHFFKLSDYKASSQIPYWQPEKNIVSRNPVPFFLKRYELIKDGLLFAKQVGINKPPHDDIQEFLNSKSGSYIINDSIISKASTEVPDDSVSLIVTDPPYSDQVPYLEYTALWDKILNLDNLSEDKLEKEIVVSYSNRRNKNSTKFMAELGQSIEEMGRVLKGNRYLAMFYHDFSLSYWKEIINAAKKANLAFLSQVHIGRKLKSLKTVWNPNRTLDGSALVFFIKDKELAQRQQQNLYFNIEDVERLVRIKADEIIYKQDGKATSQQLYDLGVLSIVIEEGNALELLSTKYKTFIQMFKKWYSFDDGYWTFKDK